MKCVGLLLLLASVASAEEGEVVPPPPAVTAPTAPNVSASDSTVVPKTKKKTKAPRFEQKENEGTQAKNRFEADSILKSEYRINGQQLEVDPD